MVFMTIQVCNFNTILIELETNFYGHWDNVTTLKHWKVKERPLAETEVGSKTKSFIVIS